MNQPDPLCANCQTRLQGAFCHQCGQEDRNYLRNAFSLVAEFMGEFSNWDNRLWRTLWPLWVRPGHVSRRYVQGHRAPYVPPLRLYLFTSIVAFLVFAQALPADGPAAPPQGVDMSQQPGPPELPFLDEATRERLQNRIVSWAENPKLGINAFFSVAPQIMFLLLPLFALFLKLLYLGSGRFYVEHLVLALHTHSFVLQLGMALIGLNGLARLLADVPLVPSALGWLITLALWLVPVYLWCSQKVFYRQGLWATSWRFVVTVSVYSVLFLSAFLFALVWSLLRS